MPADPAKMMLGERDDEQQILRINQKYHFDQPLYKQYFFYLNDLSPVSFHRIQPIYDSFLTIFSTEKDPKQFFIVLKKLGRRLKTSCLRRLIKFCYFGYVHYFV